MKPKAAFESDDGTLHATRCEAVISDLLHMSRASPEVNVRLDLARWIVINRKAIIETIGVLDESDDRDMKALPVLQMGQTFNRREQPIRSRS
jgi:hypothetical protein